MSKERQIERDPLIVDAEIEEIFRSNLDKIRPEDLEPVPEEEAAHIRGAIERAARALKEKQRSILLRIDGLDYLNLEYRASQRGLKVTPFVRMIIKDFLSGRLRYVSE